MKKYFKFGSLALYQRMVSTILAVLEVTILIVLANVILAQWNNRYMFYEPYKRIIDQDGFIVDWYKDIAVLNGDTRDMEDVMAEVKGDVSFVYARRVSVRTEDIERIDIFFLDDEVYDKYSLPLAKGTYGSSGVKNSGVIGPNKYGFTEGSKLTFTKSGKEYTIDISGVLSNPTYKPNYGEYYTKNEDNVKAFYNAYSMSNDPDPFVILPQGSNQELIEELEAEICPRMFMIFNGKMDRHTAWTNANVFDYSVDMIYMYNSTDDYLYEQLKKTVPLVIFGMLIIIIGLLGTVAINTMSQIRNYGVYFLCGAKWKDSIRISVASNGIIFAISVCLSIITYFVGIFLGAREKYGLNFRWDNIALTVLLVILLLIVSAIIPIFVLRRISPVEIIRKED